MVLSEGPARILPDPGAADAVKLRLSESLAGAPEPIEILRNVARIIGRHLQVSRVAYGEIEPGEDVIVIPAEWTDGVAPMIGRHPLHRQSGFVREYVRGRTMAVEDVRAMDLVPAEQAMMAETACRACISVPLLRDGELVALFSATHRDRRAWRAEEIALVEHAAARTWSALEHSRVIARLRASEAAMSERDRHQTFLIDWTDRVRQETDPAAITRLTVTRLAEHFGASRSGYAVAEDDGAAVRIVAEAHADGAPTLGLAYTLDRLGAEIAGDFRAGRLVRFDDAGADPRLPDKLRGFARVIGLGADLSMPLIAGGRLRGVLSVTQREARAWTAGEAQLLREVAARMWTILEKAEAREALQARERHQAFLLDWSDGVRDIEGDEAIVAFTLARIGRYLGTSRANIAEIEGKGDGARIAVRQEWFRDGHTASDRVAVSEGVYDAYLHGDVVAVEDVTADDRFDEAARAHYLAVEAASFLAAPMMSGGRVRGFLSVQDAEPRRWHPFERQLLRDIADRTWGLTERARVAAALAARERDQAFLIAWSDEVRVLDTPEAIVETTLARLGAHLSASRACHSDIQMDTGETKGGHYRIVAEWLRDTVPVKGLIYPSSNLSDEVRRTYLSGAPLVSDDMANDPRFSPAALAGFARAQVAARIAVPLSRGGEVHAILAIDAKTPRRWAEAEVALVRDVADRMWTQMERVRAEAALKERERHQAQLLAWNDRMRDERTAWGMLTGTLDQLGLALGASRVTYAEAGDDGETLHVLGEWSGGAGSVAGVSFPLAALGAGMRAALESGETFVVEDITTDPRIDDESRPLYASIEIGALLTVALVRGGRVIANLSVQKATPHVWRPSDVQLFADLAERTWSLLERRRSEERLNESEALLAAFMENAPIAMYLTDEAGRYVRVNREMAAVLDCEASDALGRTTYDFMPEAVADEAARLDRAALGGGVHAAELEIEGRDRYTHALSVRFAVPGYDGRVDRLGGFVIDLTERRKTEAELEQSRASLFQTEKLSALGSLLAGVSHELNNPLSIVVAQSVMLERQSAGSPLAERAAKVRKAADRCARIVQTFLAMARQKRPERKPADLNEIAAAAVELTSYGVRADGIAVDLQLAETLPQISADADQLHQVIVNLVVNAQQAMVDAGDAVRRGGRITVRTALGPEAGTVIVEVADTGPGVPDEARRRIFEPFFTTKPQGQGTGVGLSFSQGLVEAHGGRLALVPSKKGAVFRATLPVERDRTLAPCAPEPVAEVGAPVERRALVVDDEPEIAEALADFLSIEGFACEVTIGGAAAIARLAEDGAYDLVVSDIRMPGVDGPQLHAWIAEHRPDLLTRLAFATGDTLGQVAAIFLAEVKRPVLEKPFTPQAVRDFVRRMEGP